MRSGTDGNPIDPRWKSELAAAESHDPKALASEWPRWMLRRCGFMAMSKRKDLRDHGYQIVVWACPEAVRGNHEFAVCYEYVPRADETGLVPLGRKRVVVFTFEEQQDFHASIGAPAVTTQGELFA